MPLLRFRIRTIMVAVAIFAVVFTPLAAIVVVLRDTSVRVVGSDLVVDNSTVTKYTDSDGGVSLVHDTTITISLLLIAVGVSVFVVMVASAIHLGAGWTKGRKPLEPCARSANPEVQAAAMKPSHREVPEEA